MKKYPNFWDRNSKIFWVTSWTNALFLLSCAKSDDDKVKLFASHSNTPDPEVESMLANHRKCLVKTRPLKASDLNRVIKTLSATKAPGPDHVTAQMIQELPPSGQKILLQLYNAMLRLEYWPTKFKPARVIMILKPGKQPTEVSSYRPISLLSIISKILEKLLLHRLLSDTHSQDWIPFHQFGFRKAHSTIQQCHRLTTIINKTLEVHQYCSAVFLDISQAFDKVWHQRLLLKIQQTLPPNYFNILQSYLQTRQLVLTYNNSTSQPVHMLSGVPQGSSIRPTSLNPQIQPYAHSLMTQPSYPTTQIPSRPLETYKPTSKVLKNGLANGK